MFNKKKEKQDIQNLLDIRLGKGECFTKQLNFNSKEGKELVEIFKELKEEGKVEYKYKVLKEENKQEKKRGGGYNPNFRMYTITSIQGKKEIKDDKSFMKKYWHKIVNSPYKYPLKAKSNSLHDYGSGNTREYERGVEIIDKSIESTNQHKKLLKKLVELSLTDRFYKKTISIREKYNIRKDGYKQEKELEEYLPKNMDKFEQDIVFQIMKPFNLMDENLLIAVCSHILFNDINIRIYGESVFGLISTRDLTSWTIRDRKIPINILGVSPTSYSFQNNCNEFYKTAILLHPSTQKEDLKEYIDKCFDTVIKPKLNVEITKDSNKAFFNKTFNFSKSDFNDGAIKNILIKKKIIDLKRKGLSSENIQKLLKEEDNVIKTKIEIDGVYKKRNDFFKNG